jgi:hypothetical protein
LTKSAEADYAALAAAAMYQQNASRAGAVDRAFSDLVGTAHKNKRDGLALDIRDIDFLFPG